ncbi:MAG: hypothetical protein HC780_16865 [Leptolyngbyaceae cyanobacterium CSU_1_3]|nr:hypothetical protein [Leptolyngbyaceae cyanobacterium CSU_1_3]
MRHSPPIESPTPNQSQSLNPKLQRALGCLDIQLEEELTRYRRQRAGRSVTPTNGLKRQSAPRIELMTIAQKQPDTPPASLPLLRLKFRSV